MAKKAALRHFVDKLKVENPLDFEGINMSNTELYLDLTDPFAIIDILKNKKNKNAFKLIVRTILLNQYNDSLYRKEDEGIAAMKLMTSTNTRIYCKETTNEAGVKKIVIMAKVVSNKTSQKNDKKIKAIIKSLKETEYEYYQTQEEAKKHNS